MSRRRLIAGVAGLAMLIGLGAAPPVQPTEAAWVDSDWGNGTFTAITLLPPAVEPLPGGLTCPNPLSTLLGGTALTIKWRWPAMGFANPPTSAFNVFLASNAAGTGTTSTVAPGTPTNGVYTTSVTKGVLDGLLGGLGFVVTGGQYVVYFSTSWVTAGGVTWTSPQKVKITVTYASILAGGATTCTSTVV